MKLRKGKIVMVPRHTPAPSELRFGERIATRVEVHGKKNGRK